VSLSLLLSAMFLEDSAFVCEFAKNCVIVSVLLCLVVVVVVVSAAAAAGLDDDVDCNNNVYKAFG
jgi:hypothetical protein